MKNSKPVLRLTAVLLAAFLSLGMLCACGEDEEDNPVDEDAAARLQMILSDPWYYTDDTPVAFDQAVSKEFRENGCFEYERSAAQKVFGGDKVKVSKSARNAFVKEYGTSAFDKTAGTGVFLVGDPVFSGAGHSGFYLEYTSDKGKSWSIVDGAFYSDASPQGVRISGKRVYIIMVSQAMCKSYLLYSDDLCQSFRIRDVITLLTDYAELMYFHTTDVEIIDFNAEDGSMTLGWYDYEYVQENGGDAVSFFLTAKFNGKLTEGVVESADDEYIEKTAEKLDNTDVLND